MSSQVAISFDVETELDSRFQTFHQENPQVYRELATLAKQALERGRSNIGIKMLIEVIRWNRYLTTTGDEYKINNSYTSRYARLLVQDYPEMRDLFETRELRS